MSRDLIGAYEVTVDHLVDLIESAQAENGPEDASLFSAVDDYADRTNRVFQTLAAQLPELTQNEGRDSDLDPSRRARSARTAERLLALAASDFRLAASLVGLDAESFEPARDEWSEIAEEISGLREDMEEIKAVIRPAPEDPESGGSATSPLEPPPGPHLPQAGIPPLGEGEISGEFLFGDLELRPRASFERRDEPPAVSGAAPDPVGVTKDAIDEVVDKAASQIADLLAGSAPLTVPALNDLLSLVSGRLGLSYSEFQHALGRRGRHATRAAVKLIYEGVAKLSALLGSRAANAEALAIEFATWLGSLRLSRLTGATLDRFLRIPDLKKHVEETFERVGDDAANARAVEVDAIARSYRKGKRWRDSGPLALRACRVLRLQHVAPPASEIAMGVAVIALCATTAWVAQDHLDNPPNWPLPDFVRGVRSAVG